MPTCDTIEVKSKFFESVVFDTRGYWLGWGAWWPIGFIEEYNATSKNIVLRYFIQVWNCIARCDTQIIVSIRARVVAADSAQLLQNTTRCPKTRFCEGCVRAQILRTVANDNFVVQIPIQITILWWEVSLYNTTWLPKVRFCGGCADAAVVRFIVFRKRMIVLRVAPDWQP